MRQSELNIAVAAATGDSITTVRSRGFVLLQPIPIEREPLMVDWDALDAQHCCAIHPVSNTKSCVSRVRRRDSAAKSCR